MIWTETFLYWHYTELKKTSYTSFSQKEPVLVPLVPLGSALLRASLVNEQCHYSVQFYFHTAFAEVFTIIQLIYCLACRAPTFSHPPLISSHIFAFHCISSLFPIYLGSGWTILPVICWCLPLKCFVIFHAELQLIPTADWKKKEKKKQYR